MSAHGWPKLAQAGGVLVFALLALASGLDRASANDPRLARLVPSALAAEAHRATASQSLSAGKADLAIAQASAAIEADPIHPRSTALLGAGHLSARQLVLADRDFRVAARFGWRDPLTQIYFMDAALRAGQPRLAAMRLDAVLRQSPNYPIREMLLAQLEGSAAGRAALAERLALRPSWTAAFFGDGNSLSAQVLQARATVIAGMEGPKWGCDAVAPLVGRLVLAGSVSNAKALWRAQCPTSSEGIADPVFAALPLARQPVAFEWNRVSSGDVEARPALAPDSGLMLRVNGPSSQLVAWQMLTLAPGRYRLGWTATGARADGLTLSLACALQDRTPLAARHTGGGRFEATVDVGAGCAGQFLSLWLAPGSEEIRFANPVIAPY
jgi:hypothetical protein